MSGLLQARGLHVVLGPRAVLDEVTLSVNAGEVTALVGPNGAGKTTLLRALAGLVPSTGTITLRDQPLGAMPARQRAREIAYLPQGHSFHWPLSVESIVMLGRMPHADPFSNPTAHDRDAAQHAMALTGTTAFAQRAVTSLSGGERARVALARVLATQAAVLLADEPTAALDPRHQLLVMDLLRTIARKGAAVFAVLHDLTLAARYADRVLVLDQGRLVANAPPQQALSTDRLAQVFGIESVSIDTGDGVVPVGLRALKNDGAAASDHGAQPLPRR